MTYKKGFVSSIALLSLCTVSVLSSPIVLHPVYAAGTLTDDQKSRIEALLIKEITNTGDDSDVEDFLQNSDVQAGLQVILAGKTLNSADNTYLRTAPSNLKQRYLRIHDALDSHLPTIREKIQKNLLSRDSSTLDDPGKIAVRNAIIPSLPSVTGVDYASIEARAYIDKFVEEQYNALQRSLNIDLRRIIGAKHSLEPAEKTNHQNRIRGALNLQYSAEGVVVSPSFVASAIDAYLAKNKVEKIRGVITPQALTSLLRIFNNDLTIYNANYNAKKLIEEASIKAGLDAEFGEENLRSPEDEALIIKIAQEQIQANGFGPPHPNFTRHENWMRENARHLLFSNYDISTMSVGDKLKVRERLMANLQAKYPREGQFFNFATHDKAYLDRIIEEESKKITPSLSEAEYTTLDEKISTQVTSDTQNTDAALAAIKRELRPGSGATLFNAADEEIIKARIEAEKQKKLVERKATAITNFLTGKSETKANRTVYDVDRAMLSELSSQHLGGNLPDEDDVRQEWAEIVKQSYETEKTNSVFKDIDSPTATDDDKAKSDALNRYIDEALATEEFAAVDRDLDDDKVKKTAVRQKILERYRAAHPDAAPFTDYDKAVVDARLQAKIREIPVSLVEYKHMQSLLGAKIADKKTLRRGEPEKDMIQGEIMTELANTYRGGTQTAYYGIVPAGIDARLSKNVPSVAETLTQSQKEQIEALLIKEFTKIGPRFANVGVILADQGVKKALEVILAGNAFNDQDKTSYLETTAKNLKRSAINIGASSLGSLLEGLELTILRHIWSKDCSVTLNDSDKIVIRNAIINTLKGMRGNPDVSSVGAIAYIDGYIQKQYIKLQNKLKEALQPIGTKHSLEPAEKTTHKNRIKGTLDGQYNQEYGSVNVPDILVGEAIDAYLAKNKEEKIRGVLTDEILDSAPIKLIFENERTIYNAKKLIEEASIKAGLQAIFPEATPEDEALIINVAQEQIQANGFEAPDPNFTRHEGWMRENARHLLFSNYDISTMSVGDKLKVRERLMANLQAKHPDETQFIYFTLGDKAYLDRIIEEESKKITPSLVGAEYTTLDEKISTQVTSDTQNTDAALAAIKRELRTGPGATSFNTADEEIIKARIEAEKQKKLYTNQATAITNFLTGKSTAMPNRTVYDLDYILLNKLSTLFLSGNLPDEDDVSQEWAEIVKQSYQEQKNTSVFKDIDSLAATDDDKAKSDALNRYIDEALATEDFADLNSDLDDDKAKKIAVREKILERYRAAHPDAVAFTDYDKAVVDARLQRRIRGIPISLVEYNHMQSLLAEQIANKKTLPGGDAEKSTIEGEIKKELADTYRGGTQTVYGAIVPAGINAHLSKNAAAVPDSANGNQQDPRPERSESEPIDRSEESQQSEPTNPQSGGQPSSSSSGGTDNNASNEESTDDEEEENADIDGDLPPPPVAGTLTPDQKEQIEALLIKEITNIGYYDANVEDLLQNSDVQAGLQVILAGKTLNVADNTYLRTTVTNLNRRAENINNSLSPHLNYLAKVIKKNLLSRDSSTLNDEGKSTVRNAVISFWRNSTPDLRSFNFASIEAQAYIDRFIEMEYADLKNKLNRQLQSIIQDKHSLNDAQKKIDQTQIKEALQSEYPDDEIIVSESFVSNAIDAYLAKNKVKKEETIRGVLTEEILNSPLINPMFSNDLIFYNAEKNAKTLIETGEIKAGLDTAFGASEARSPEDEALIINVVQKKIQDHFMSPDPNFTRHENWMRENARHLLFSNYDISTMSVGDKLKVRERLMANLQAKHPTEAQFFNFATYDRAYLDRIIEEERSKINPSLAGAEYTTLDTQISTQVTSDTQNTDAALAAIKSTLRTGPSATLLNAADEEIIKERIEAAKQKKLHENKATAITNFLTEKKTTTSTVYDVDRGMLSELSSQHLGGNLPDEDDVRQEWAKIVKQSYEEQKNTSIFKGIDSPTATDDDKAKSDALNRYIDEALATEEFAALDRDLVRDKPKKIAVRNKILERYKLAHPDAAPFTQYDEAVVDARLQARIRGIPVSLVEYKHMQSLLGAKIANRSTLTDDEKRTIDGEITTELANTYRGGTQTAYGAIVPAGVDARLSKNAAAVPGAVPDSANGNQQELTPEDPTPDSEQESQQSEPTNPQSGGQPSSSSSGGSDNNASNGRDASRQTTEGGTDAGRQTSEDTDAGGDANAETDLPPPVAGTLTNDQKSRIEAFLITEITKIGGSNDVGAILNNPDVQAGLEEIWEGDTPNSADNIYLQTTASNLNQRVLSIIGSLASHLPTIMEKIQKNLLSRDSSTLDDPGKIAVRNAIIPSLPSVTGVDYASIEARAYIDSYVEEQYNQLQSNLNIDLRSTIGEKHSLESAEKTTHQNRIRRVLQSRYPGEGVVVSPSFVSNAIDAYLAKNKVEKEEKIRGVLTGEILNSAPIKPIFDNDLTIYNAKKLIEEASIKAGLQAIFPESSRSPEDEALIIKIAQERIQGRFMLPHPDFIRHENWMRANARHLLFSNYDISTMSVGDKLKVRERLMAKIQAKYPGEEQFNWFALQDKAYLDLIIEEESKKITPSLVGAEYTTLDAKISTQVTSDTQNTDAALAAIKRQLRTGPSATPFNTADEEIIKARIEAEKQKKLFTNQAADITHFLTEDSRTTGSPSVYDLNYILLNKLSTLFLSGNLPDEDDVSQEWTEIVKQSYQEQKNTSVFKDIDSPTATDDDKAKSDALNRYIEEALATEEFAALNSDLDDDKVKKIAVRNKILGRYKAAHPDAVAFTDYDKAVVDARLQKRIRGIPISLVEYKHMQSLLGAKIANRSTLTDDEKRTIEGEITTELANTYRGGTQTAYGAIVPAGVDARLSKNAPPVPGAVPDSANGNQQELTPEDPTPDSEQESQQSNQPEPTNPQSGGQPSSSSSGGSDNNASNEESTDDEEEGNDSTKEETSIPSTNISPQENSLVGSIHPSLAAFMTRNVAFLKVLQQRWKNSWGTGEEQKTGKNFWSSFSFEEQFIQDKHVGKVESQSKNFIVGIDFAPYKNFIYGIFGLYGRSDVKAKDIKSSAVLDDYTLGVHANAFYNEKFMISLGTSFSQEWLKTYRSVQSFDLKADYPGNIIRVFGEFAYPLEYKSLKIEPFVDFVYSSIHVNKFQEFIGDQKVLDRISMKGENLFSTLGVRLEKSLTNNLFVKGSVGFRQGFGDLMFVQEKNIVSYAIPKDTLRLNLGLDWHLGQAGISVSYDGEMDIREKFYKNDANIKIGVSF